MISPAITNNVKEFLRSVCINQSGFDNVVCTEHEDNTQAANSVRQYRLNFNNHKHLFMGEVVFAIDYETQEVEYVSTTGCFYTEAMTPVLDGIKEDVETYLILATAMLVHVVDKLTEHVVLKIDVEFIDSYNMQFTLSTYSNHVLGSFVATVEDGIFSITDSKGLAESDFMIKCTIIDIFNYLNQMTEDTE